MAEQPELTLAATSPGPQILAEAEARKCLPVFPTVNWDKYEFLSLLGTGGMGAVYKARDRQLDRMVALKFIYGDNPALMQRFQQEAHAQARLDHPNICRVHEVGQVEGKPYITMQFVEGASLDRVCAEIALHDKVQLIRDVALALHEAHRLGIIHRDIKPANIMLERLPDGRFRPVVMDFGLARESGESRGLTETGVVMGTPAYMPPEQARGGGRHLDRRADVYSLGATLYELLTAQPPFTGAEVVEVILAVLTDDPKPLRALAPDVPADLETIVLKCLAKEPAQRYDSARALAEDLQRYIDGEPILGRRSSLSYRVRRYMRRHKALFVLGSAAALLTLTLLGFGLQIELRGRRQARLAQQLGQDITEMELFMRAAYGLPLHDISREQAVIRSRMARIAGTLGSADAPEAAALRYALGRGHLVLHEYAEAQAALEQGWQGGYRTAEARLALGLVLGERYRQELENAQRVDDKRWIASREQALSTQYLKPALWYLDGASSGIEAPAYIQGLLLFYRKQYEQALSFARRAQVEAPWLAEPIRLEGDVYQVMGIGRLNSGQHGEGRALLVRAAELHHRAATINSSDSVIYEAAAVDWIRIMEIDSETGAALSEGEKGALEEAEHAIGCDPRAAHGFALKGWAYWWLGYTKAQRNQGGEFEFQQSVDQGNKAVARNPADWQSHYYYSRGLGALATLASNRGEDATDLNQKSIIALEQSIKLNQNFAGAWSALGLRYATSFEEKTRHGVLDAHLFSAALDCFHHAIQLEKNDTKSYLHQAGLLISKMGFLSQHGESIESDAALATDAINRALAINPNSTFSYLHLIEVRLNQVECASLCGVASSELFEQVLKALAQLRALNPAHGANDLGYVIYYYLRASSELRLGRDPSPAIVAGLQAVTAGEKENATHPDLASYKARLLVIAGRALGSDERADARFAQAVAAARRAVALRSRDAEPQEILCEAYRHATAARSGPRKLTLKQAAETADWIEQGLNACTAALAINPTLATAYGNKGALFALKARRETDTAAVRLAVMRAIDALGKAVTINKCLRREYGPLLDAAQALDLHPATR